MVEKKNSVNKKLEKISVKYEKFANAFIYIGVFLFISGIVIFMLPHQYHDKFGAFGEFFGGIIGSFWSLAGVFLFYSALKNQAMEFDAQREQLDLQRDELKLQRNELRLQRYETELQRKEFERQTQQLVAQNETLSVQKFENTFFHLLSLHNDIVSSNEARDLGKKWAKTLYIRFIGNYQRIAERQKDLDKKELICKAYMIFPKRIEYLDRYFNNLTYCFKFIELSNIPNKKFYVSLIRAQLTVHEQLFLFYFGISEFSDETLIKILEENNFFEELPTDELIEINHLQFYDKSAFDRFKGKINEDEKT